MYHDNAFSPGRPGQRPPAPDGFGQVGFGGWREPPAEAVRSCAELKLWLKFAAPNEERRYAAGYVLQQACSGILREYVMVLAERGFLTPHRMRASDGTPVHIVKRTRTPLIEGQL